MHLQKRVFLTVYFFDFMTTFFTIVSSGLITLSDALRQTILILRVQQATRNAVTEWLMLHESWPRSEMLTF